VLINGTQFSQLTGAGFPSYIGLSGREVGLRYWGGELFFSTTIGATLFICWKGGKNNLYTLLLPVTI
jgi:hypothetical protein